MTAPLVPVRLRVAPVAAPAGPWQPTSLPRRLQVIRAHADEEGRLLQAVRLGVEDGRVYLADITAPAHDEGEARSWAGRQALPGFPGQQVVPAVLTPEQWGKRLLRAWWGKGASPLCWDAPATFGPLAQHARRSDGGISCDLVGGGAPSKKRPGRWADNDERPRVRFVAKGDGGVFVSLQAPRGAKGRRRRHRLGAPLIDLGVVAGALGACASSLVGACASYGLPWPDEAGLLDQLLAEALVLLQLYERLLADLHELAPGLPPQACWSAGSVITAALRRAGVADPAWSTAGLPGWALGACAASVHGGISQALLVGLAMPMSLVDLRSTYPALFSLLALTPHLAADRFEIEDVPIAEVEKLFAGAGFRDSLDGRSWWEAIGSLFVLVEPRGELLPCAAKLGRRWRSLVAPFDFSGGVVAVHAADLVAPALAGRLPRLVKAFRVLPVGTTPGLGPVRLPSGAACDLRTEDYGRALIAEREAADATGDPLARARRGALAKAVAVSGGWGVFGRCDLRQHREPVKSEAYGLGGEHFSDEARRTDEPGPVTLWHVAAAVPAACRAVVAAARHDIEAQEGSAAAVLTDAIAVPAGPEADLVACPGGPHRLADGTEAVRLLAHDELRALLGRFDHLLHPWGGPAWKQVAGSLDQLTWGLVLGTNRVLLGREEEGHFRLVRSCDFGLGDHFVDPTGTGATLWDGRLAWCAALQEPVMAAAVENGGAPLGQGVALPPSAGLPAARARRAVSWGQLARLREQVGDPSVAPFAAYAEAQLFGSGRAPVALGAGRDPAGWRSWPWRRDGGPFGVAVKLGDGAPPEVEVPSQVCATVGEVFLDWLGEDDPATAGPERGLRQMAPVRSHPALLRFVGKAPDDDKGRVAGGEPKVYGTGDAAEVLGKARSLRGCELAARGLPERTARRVVAASHEVRRATLERLAAAVAEVSPAQTCAGCGAELPPGSRSGRRWCSEACRRAAARGRPTGRRCRRCGASLDGRGDKGYCNATCRKAAERARRAGSPKTAAPAQAPAPAPEAPATQPELLDRALSLLADLPGLPEGTLPVLRRSAKLRGLLAEALPTVTAEALAERVGAEGPLRGESPVGILVSRLTALVPAMAAEAVERRRAALEGRRRQGWQLGAMQKRGELPVETAEAELRLITDPELRRAALDGYAAGLGLKSSWRDKGLSPVVGAQWS